MLYRVTNCLSDFLFCLLTNNSANHPVPLMLHLVTTKGAWFLKPSDTSTSSSYILRRSVLWHFIQAMLVSFPILGIRSLHISTF